MQLSDHDERRANLHELARDFLPLVDSLQTLGQCLIPLEACALLSYGWEDKAGKEVPLAEAVLRRLGSIDLDTMPPSSATVYLALWRALAHMPRAAAARHAGTLAEVSRSAARTRWTQAECLEVFQLCVRGRHAPGPMLHHLTKVLSKGEPALGVLAGALRSLADLRMACGHVPDPQHLQALAVMAAARLGDEAEVEGRQEHVAQLLEAYGKLQIANPDLLKLLAAAVQEGAKGMAPEQLVGALQGLGGVLRRDTAYPSFLARAVEGVAAEVQRWAEGAKPDAVLPVADTLHSLAVLHGPLRADGHVAAVRAVDAAIHAVADVCLTGSHLAREGLGALGRAAVSLSYMGFQDHRWYEAAVDAAAMDRGSSTSPSELAGLARLWRALRVVQHRPHYRLVERTARALRECLEDPSPTLVTGLLHSVALLGVNDRKLTRLLFRVAQPWRYASNGELAQALWAAAVLGPEVLCANAQEVEVLLREVVRRWQGAEEGAAPFTEAELVLLSVAGLELESLADSRNKSSSGSGRKDRDKKAASEAALYQMLHQATGGGRRPSARQPALLAAASAVSEPQHEGALAKAYEALHRALVRVQQEQQQRKEPAGAAAQPSIASVTWYAAVDGLGARRVPLLVELVGGRRLAVEVEGLEAFLANEPHTRTRTGAAQLRARQLERVLGEGNVVWVSIGACSQVAGDDGREEALVAAVLQGQDAVQELQEALEASGDCGSGIRAPRGAGLPQPQTLGELQQAVETGAEEWAEEGDVAAFLRAFSQAPKVGH